MLLVFSTDYVQAGQTYSESFPLVESASVSRSVFAAEGDRIVGSFTVSDVPTWTDSSTGNPETVQYAFKVSKIEGLEKCPTDIILFEVYQTNNASFDVFCEYTGDYRFRFNVGISAPDFGIGSMKATLNYTVVENSFFQDVTETPVPSSSEPDFTPSLSGTDSSPPLFIEAAALIIIFIVGGILGMKIVKRSSHQNQELSLFALRL